MENPDTLRTKAMALQQIAQIKVLLTEVVYPLLYIPTDIYL